MQISAHIFIFISRDTLDLADVYRARATLLADMSHKYRSPMGPGNCQRQICLSGCPGRCEWVQIRWKCTLNEVGAVDLKSKMADELKRGFFDLWLNSLEMQIWYEFIACSHEKYRLTKFH